MARKRRPVNDPLVTVEVPQSVANALLALTAEDILKLKHDKSLLHKVFKFVEFGLLAYLLVACIYIFGISQSVYEKAVANCTSTMTTSTGIKEEQVNRICVDLSSSLKPSDKPLERLAQVWTWTSRPVEDVLGKIFIVGYEYKYIGGKTETPASVVQSVTKVDYSGEVDELGNPSLKAVVQEAIRLQPEYDVPWRYVVDACFYESGGLRQYSSVGVLTQGVNKNPDGSVSSTDWGMCQINDYWHPNLMTMAKGSWQGNLKASFEVMSNGWVEASKLPENEYQRRLLWARYNGSGPYDLYADRVVKTHAALELKIQQILEELENDKKAPAPDTYTGNDGVTVTVDLARDVPVYDGEAANIRQWAISNPSWTVKAGQDWHFCAQTDKSGWAQYTNAGSNLNAFGICANTSMIDKAVALFGNKLEATDSTDHSGSHPWFTKAVNCPDMDYVIHNGTGRDVIFEHSFDGDLLTLRIRYAENASPVTSVNDTPEGEWPIQDPGREVTDSMHGYPWGKDVSTAAASTGQVPVYATMSGRISLLIDENRAKIYQPDGTSGDPAFMNSWFVITNDTSGWSAIYLHLCIDPNLAEEGTIAKGQVIGYVCSIGNSTGPHVHYAVSNNLSDPYGDTVALTWIQ